MKTTVLCIYRAACYSPGMVERDEAILRAVASRLEHAGYAVSLIHEEEFTAAVPMPDVVLHMTRSSRALDILARWQAAGCRVINSVEGIRSVERAFLAELCARQGIPTPTTWIVSTTEAPLTAYTTKGELTSITFPCWVKRTGSCAQEPDDVRRADDADEYQQCLSHLRSRGIPKAVVMAHIEGQNFKFYAVEGPNFYYCLPATSLGYDKFSSTPHDKHPDASAEDTETPNFSLSSLTLPPTGVDLRFHFPLGLPIFGGDFIVGPDGVARLIDLNDWPSFSACRDEAADAIARLVIS